MTAEPDHPTDEHAERIERGVADDEAMAPEPTAPGDNDTSSGVLASFAEQGIRASFVPGAEPGSLRCTVCDTESAAGRFEVVAERRLEGASDPDDMVVVMGLRCPVCHISGAVVLGFGAEASTVDADIVAALAPAPGSASSAGASR